MMIQTQRSNGITYGRQTAIVRRGFTVIELLISMMVLVTVMTVAGTLIYKTDLIWRDTARERVAIAELNNQLDELSLLPLADLQSRLSDLEPSDLCKQTLVAPTLNGALIDDSLGRRLVLSLNWQRRHPGKPVQLAAWLVVDSDAGQNGPVKVEDGR